MLLHCRFTEMGYNLVSLYGKTTHKFFREHALERPSPLVQETQIIFLTRNNKRNSCFNFSEVLKNLKANKFTFFS